MYETKEKIKADILNLLKKKWNANSSYLTFADNKYYLPSQQEFKDYLSENKAILSSLTSYSLTEGFDCDDYSFLLKGHVSLFNREVARKKHSWAVGIIWANFSWISGFHAANLVVTSDNGLFLIEPQYNINGFYRFDECLGNVHLLVM